MDEFSGKDIKKVQFRAYHRKFVLQLKNKLGDSAKSNDWLVASWLGGSETWQIAERISQLSQKYVMQGRRTRERTLLIRREGEAFQPKIYNFFLFTKGYACMVELKKRTKLIQIDRDIIVQRKIALLISLNLASRFLFLDYTISPAAESQANTKLLHNIAQKSHKN